MTQCFEMGVCPDGVALARVSLGHGKVLVGYSQDRDGNHGILFRELTEPVAPGTVVKGDDPNMGGRAMFVLCNSREAADVLLRAATKLCFELAGTGKEPDK